MVKRFLLTFYSLLIVSLTNAQSTYDSLNWALLIQSIEYNMIMIDGGTFNMGCTMDVRSVGDEFPVHEVTVTLSS